MTCSSYGVLRLLILLTNSGEPLALITGEYKMEFRGKSGKFSVSLRAFLQKLGFYFKTEIETTLWHIEKETDVAQISF